MTADASTIVATSGGMIPGRRTRWEVAPLIDYALDLSGVSGRAPRVCFLATATGDNPAVIAALYEAAAARGLRTSHLAVFPMPNVADVAGHLLAQDLIWVAGGSVAGLLTMWRLHDFDSALRSAWQAGVVLGGVSAGSMCWHVGGTTDSFGPDLRTVTDGLALVPHANGVHYDSEAQRRPIFQSRVQDRTLPAGYATDDGVGLVYRGIELAEAVTEVDGRAAYFVEPGPDGVALETRLPSRRL